MNGSIDVDLELMAPAFTNLVARWSGAQWEPIEYVEIYNHTLAINEQLLTLT